MFKYAVDGLDGDIRRSTLILFAGALVLMAVLGGIARFYMRRLVIGASREIEFELRNDFFARLTTLSFSYYNRTPTGDLMARATNDLNAVRMVLGPGIMYSVNTVVTLIAALTLMLVLSWQLTLIALIPLPAHLALHVPLRPGHPQAVRGGAGAVLRHHGPRPGVPGRGPGGEGLHPGRGRHRGLPRRRTCDYLEEQHAPGADQRPVLPRHRIPRRHRQRAGAGLRRRAGDPRGRSPWGASSPSTPTWSCSSGP